MLFEAKNLSKTFKTGWLKQKKVCAVSRAEISLKRGETIGIVGESGAGKTTLGLMLTGLLKPDRCRDRYHILFRGEEIWSLPRRRRRRYRRFIQIVFQNPESVFNPRWKLRRSLFEPYRLHAIPFSENTISEQLASVGLGTEMLSRHPSQVSGGELQRLAIARVMSMNPAIVILDEPTSMLDTITEGRIIRLLQDIQERSGVSYIFITHDLDLSRFFCDRIHELKEAVLTRISYEEYI